MAKPIDKKSGKILIVFIIFLGVFWGYTHFVDSPNAVSSKTVNARYDTDPKNDSFIIGTLEPKQLKLLDKILKFEQKNNGLRLSDDELVNFVQNDKAVLKAYQRWRRCKEMRRSEYHTIYPNERK